MKCTHCHLPIKPNEGPAKDEAPYVHYDGFIICHRRQTVATPQEVTR